MAINMLNRNNTSIIAMYRSVPVNSATAESKTEPSSGQASEAEAPYRVSLSRQGQAKSEANFKLTQKSEEVSFHRKQATERAEFERGQRLAEAAFRREFQGSEKSSSVSAVA